MSPAAHVSSPTARGLAVLPLVSRPVNVPKLITSPLTPFEILLTTIPIARSSESCPPVTSNGATSILPLGSAPTAPTKVPLSKVEPVLFRTR